MSALEQSSSVPFGALVVNKGTVEDLPGGSDQYPLKWMTLPAEFPVHCPCSHGVARFMVGYRPHVLSRLVSSRIHNG